MPRSWSGWVVGLVCSAGGLDALTRVVRKLPADFPAALVVVQHVDPSAKTMLPAILGNRSPLPVEQARNRSVLRAGSIYVTPPGHHALLTNEGRILVFRSGAYPPSRPSGDLLLSSMALTVGPKAIAVVMSGYGHDGATGAAAVHELGGTVIAATAESSLQSAMPVATVERLGVVDHLVSVDDIGSLLTTLVARDTDRLA